MDIRLDTVRERSRCTAPVGLAVGALAFAACESAPPEPSSPENMASIIGTPSLATFNGDASDPLGTFNGTTYVRQTGGGMMRTVRGKPWRL